MCLKENEMGVQQKTKIVEGKRKSRCNSPLNCINKKQGKRKSKKGASATAMKTQCNDVPPYHVRHFGVPQSTIDPVRIINLRPETRSGRVIAPSDGSLHRMRKIGALGMEDPVFGTKDHGPSHPSQIFDDMSLGDVPSDMRDLISVASDPTAEMDNGIDSSVFHSSLGDLHISFADFSQSELVRNVDSFDESQEFQSGTKSRCRTHHTKHTYVSAKVDPWGLQKNNRRQSFVTSDTSDTRSVTSAMSLSIQDLGAGPPSPRTPSSRKHRDRIATYHPHVAPSPVGKLQTPLLNQYLDANGTALNYTSAKHWGKPYHTQVSSYFSASSSSRDSGRKEQRSSSEASMLSIKRRSSTGNIDRQMLAESSVLKSPTISEGCLELDTNEKIAVKNDEWSQRQSALAKIGSSSRKERVVELSGSERSLSRSGRAYFSEKIEWNRVKPTFQAVGPLSHPNPTEQQACSSVLSQPQETTLDRSMLASQSIPEFETSSNVNSMPNIVMELKSEADCTGSFVACPPPSRNIDETIATAYRKKKNRTPYVVECSSSKGMEPRLLPTLAVIFEDNFRKPKTRTRTRRFTVGGNESSQTETKIRSSDAPRRSSIDSLKPASVRSFYYDDEDMLKEICKTSNVAARDSSRYFESTHAVKSVISSSTMRLAS